MGLFSERCPNCGKSLSRQANFCSACRWSMGKAMISCTRCGSACGEESNFCWHCNDDLHAQPGRQVFDDRWILARGDLAARFPIRTPKERVRHGLQIDHGLTGIVYHYQNGPAVARRLEAGYYPFDGFLDRLFASGGEGDDLRAVLVDTRTFDLRFESTDLADAGRELINTAVTIELRIADPDLFAGVFLRDLDLAGKHHLGERMDGPLDHALTAEFAKVKLADLAADSLLRTNLESGVARAMAEFLRQQGVEIISVRTGRFGGAAWDRLVEQRSSLAAAARDYDYRREMEALEQAGRLASFRSRKEMEDEMHRIANQFGRRDEERTYADRLWHIRQDHILTLELAENERLVKRLKREEEIEDLTHSIAKDEMKDEALTGQAKRDVERRKIVREEQMESLRKLVDLDLYVEAEESRIRTSTLDRTVEILNEARSPLVVLAAVDPNARAVLADYLKSSGAWPAGASGSNGASDSDLSAPAASIAPAVGFVAELGPGGQRRPFGTVWGWRDFRVATNAHVIDGAEAALALGRQVVVVFPSCPDRNFTVSVMRRHPRYTGSNVKLASGHEMPPAFDVGWMRLDERPPACLRTARSATLHQLRQGQPLAYNGFPSEGLPGGGVNAAQPAPPLMQSGNLALMCGWDLAGSAPNTAFLLIHTLGVTGGASGSPLWNRHGEVIGIISAASMNARLDPASLMELLAGRPPGDIRFPREPSGAMVNFAQRVDLLDDIA